MNRVETIRKSVADLKLFHDQKCVQFTISKGVAKKSMDTATLDDVLKKTDLALYEAKETGRNKAIFR